MRSESAHVARSQLRGDLFELQSSRAQQDQKMIKKVRELIDHVTIAAAHRGEGDLEAFLTDFLCYAADAVLEQARGVAACGAMKQPLTYNTLKIAEYRKFGPLKVPLVAKAGGRPLVTGGALRAREHEQRVAVAVGENLSEAEDIPRSLAFLPQSLLAPAEEDDSLPSETRLERLTIHVPQHQYGAPVGVLHDRWHETAALGEVKTFQVVELNPGRSSGHAASRAGSLTQMPADRSARLSSGMAIVPE